MAGGQKQKPLASNFHQRFSGFVPGVAPSAAQLSLTVRWSIFAWCLTAMPGTATDCHTHWLAASKGTRATDNIVSMTTKSAQISGPNAFSIY